MVILQGNWGIWRVIEGLFGEESQLEEGSEGD